MTDRRAVARAWWTFRESGSATLAFLAARTAIVPWRRLDPELRTLRGRVLSPGCGFGLIERYLALISPDVVIEGLELDESRVRAAAASSHREPRVSVRHGDVRSLSGDATFDAALAVDVFHHIPSADHEPVASALFEALRPGATCIVKEIDTVPAWKHRFTEWQDRLVTGERSIDARSSDEMAGVLRSAGFAIDAVSPIGRFSPYPHYLVRAHRPA